MTATLPEANQPVEPQPSPGAPAQPSAAMLEDRLPLWFRTTPASAGLVFALGLLFFVLSTLPLVHTEVWGHLAYGRELWRRGVFPLPATEPLMPLAEGVRFVDTAWLSQLIGYGAYQWMGTAALRFLFAAGVTFCAALLVRRLYGRTGSAVVAACGLGLFLWTAAEPLAVAARTLRGVDGDLAQPFAASPRPELAGLACFVAAFFLLTARRWSRANWVVIPALFMLWANLHGGVLPGLFLLAAFAVGRGIDLQRRVGDWRFLPVSPAVRRYFLRRGAGDRRTAALDGRALLADPVLRRYVLLTELAFVATLVNPYGLGLYGELLARMRDPNLQQFLVWDPLTLRMGPGRAFVFTAVLLVFCYRLSPRRVRGAEAVLLLGLGAATLWNWGAIVWWAPVAAYYLVLHANAAWNRDRAETARERRSLWTVVSLGLAFIAVSLTPLGLSLRQGRRADSPRDVTALTPVRAADYFREHPPRGLIYNPPDLGDYLLWAGPPGMPVYATSQAEHLPEEAWTKAVEAARGGGGWRDVLMYDGINTVVLDKRRHERLVEAMQRSNDWRPLHDDGRMIVLARNEPI